jgi:hypothetical protein
LDQLNLEVRLDPWVRLLLEVRWVLLAQQLPVGRSDPWDLEIPEGLSGLSDRAIPVGQSGLSDLEIPEDL